MQQETNLSLITSKEDNFMVYSGLIYGLLFDAINVCIIFKSMKISRITNLHVINSFWLQRI